MLLHIQEATEAAAWRSLATHFVVEPGNEVGPTLIEIEQPTLGHNPEDRQIVQCLDRRLEVLHKPVCSTVANTIFPQSIWTKSENREELFGRYATILPKVRQRRQNQYGTYFERLTQYPQEGGEPTNQLEQILSAYNAGVRRRSALQAVLLCPRRDLTLQRRRGFPCLQLVSFSPREGVALNVQAVYVTQYAAGRALGNFFGLARLGAFMAEEMGLQLGRLSCIALTMVLDESKAALREVLERVGEAES